MDRKKIYQSVIFLIVGIALFWMVYKDTDIHILKAEIAQFNLFWIGISILLNLLSQFVRALRWGQLFEPLHYKPKLYNLFLAVLILSFTNLIIPRGGEVARLTVINRTDKIPFSKLLGTALVERLTDLVILLFIFVFILIWQFQLVKQFFYVPELRLMQFHAGQVLLVIAITISIVTIIFLGIKRLEWYRKIMNKFEYVKKDIGEGFLTLSKLKHKTKYMLESLVIYALWVLMLYVLFIAYPPTQHLSFEATAYTFGLASLAFLLPIQAGMGAWHFVVIQCLLIFGVDTESGKAFSLIAHATTNLVYLIIGLIALVLLPLVNKTDSQMKVY